MLETRETPIPNRVIPTDTGCNESTLFGVVHNGCIAQNALVFVQVEHRDTSLYSELIVSNATGCTLNNGSIGGF